MEKGIDYYSCEYENILILGDFNADENNETMSNFMNTYNLNNLIKDFTCFKSDNPTCIDLILTNKSSSFQNSGTIATGLSDFHCMIIIITVLKGGFRKR